MPAAPTHPLEARLARLLTGMMIASASVIVLGLLLLLVQGSPLQSVRSFADITQPPPGLGLYRSPRDIATGVLAIEPLAIVQAGLLLLVLTPLARVAVTLVAFALQRDWVYTCISLVVLAALVTGLVGAFA